MPLPRLAETCRPRHQKLAAIRPSHPEATGKPFGILDAVTRSGPLPHGMGLLAVVPGAPGSGTLRRSAAACKRAATACRLRADPWQQRRWRRHHAPTNVDAALGAQRLFRDRVRAAGPDGPGHRAGCGTSSSRAVWMRARLAEPSAASTIEPVIPGAATRACAAGCHGCRRRGDSDDCARSGTSAVWLADSAAAHRTPARYRGGRHRRTNRGGCGRSCRADATRPADPAAPGQGWGLWAPSSAALLLRLESQG